MQVLRFWNNDVPRNFEGVLEEIRFYLSSPSPCALPHQGGGETPLYVRGKTVEKAVAGSNCATVASLSPRERV
ncbi:MAG: hypothetical protein ACREV2_05090 [Burkholderiales bacterium]